MSNLLHRMLMSVILLLGSTGVSWGQEEEEAVKSYVASYFIVGLGIALGLAAICKSAMRRKEVKRPG